MTNVISHYDDESGLWEFVDFNPRNWLCTRAWDDPACTPNDCTWPQCRHLQTKRCAEVGEKS